MAIGCQAQTVIEAECLYKDEIAKQQRTAENSREQQKTAENSREQQRTAENS